MKSSIAISISHPVWRADDITACLKIDPDRCWDKGAACNGPDGRPLAGRHKATYWRAGWVVEEPYLGLAAIINAQLDRLSLQEDFIRSISETGGRVVLEIFWDFHASVTDDELPVELLLRLGQFGIGLEFKSLPTGT